LARDVQYKANLLFLREVIEEVEQALVEHGGIPTHIAQRGLDLKNKNDTRSIKSSRVKVTRSRKNESDP
jgi:hypothetical protein